MIARGFGWRPNRPDARDRGFALLAAHPSGTIKAGDLPPSASLGAYVSSPVRDQTTTGSCVGQSFARLIDTRLSRALSVGTLGTKKMSAAHPYPSALAIYAFARSIEAGDPSVALTDEGCEPRDAAKGITVYGWPPESVWPFDEGAVNDRPTWDALQASGDDRVRPEGYYWLDAPATRSDDVARALASGYPVGIGFAVDQAFNDYAGGVLAAPTGTILGLHMTTIMGYATDAKGARVFTGCNSWGASWGEGGFFRASEAWLNDPRVSDLVVLTLEKAGAIL